MPQLVVVVGALVLALAIGFAFRTGTALAEVTWYDGSAVLARLVRHLWRRRPGPCEHCGRLSPPCAWERARPTRWAHRSCRLAADRRVQAREAAIVRQGRR